MLNSCEIKYSEPEISSGKRSHTNACMLFCGVLLRFSLVITEIWNREVTISRLAMQILCPISGFQLLCVKLMGRKCP